MHHRIEMRTELQIQTSRANGAKSHGPQTPEGKQASSRNAMTHGLLSGTVVRRRIGRTFEALFSAVLAELQPQTPVEHSLVENMTVARWRQLRIRGMEKASMEYEISRQAEASPAPADNATIAALAFRALSNDSRSLKLINRYEARYDRQYLGAHRRTPPAAEPPQPETAAPNPPMSLPPFSTAATEAEPANDSNPRNSKISIFADEPKPVSQTAATLITTSDSHHVCVRTTRSCGSPVENPLWGILATLLLPKPGLAW